MIVSTHKAFLIKLFQELCRHFYTSFFFGITVIGVSLVAELGLEDGNILVSLAKLFHSLSLSLFVV